MSATGTPANPASEYSILPDDVGQRCYDTFKFYPRKEQLEVVETIGRHQDCILIAGTGWGKTLVYFLPLVLWPKEIIVIITPLRALGDEQSEKLDLSGIPNIHLKKGTEFSVSDLVKGKYRAVFMSPEIIFQNPRVSSLWSIPEWKNRLRAVVVDEAHCIGTWGGQFRTDYAKLGHLRAKVSPSTCFVAVSAILPPVLLSEVLKTLHFSNPVIFNYGNDRTNIQLHVKQLRYKASSYQDLEFLKDGIKTIVYFDEIRQAEAAARHVGELIGCRQVAVYHSMKSDPLKKIRMSDFKNNEIQVLMSTEAAGMGCDMNDVIRVIQYGYPKNLSTLIQRLGRAARNPDLEGDGILLVPASNSKSIGNVDKDIVEYVKTTGCRRELLNNFFGNQHKVISRCCDICNPSLPSTEESLHGLVAADTSDSGSILPKVSFTEAERKVIVKAIETWRYNIFKEQYEGRSLFVSLECIMSNKMIKTLAGKVARIKPSESVQSVIPWHSIKQDHIKTLDDMIVDLKTDIMARRTQSRAASRPSVQDAEAKPIQQVHHLLEHQQERQYGQFSTIQGLEALLKSQKVHHLIRQPPLKQLIPWDALGPLQHQECHCCKLSELQQPLEQQQLLLQQILQAILSNPPTQQLLLQPPLNQLLLRQPLQCQQPLQEGLQEHEPPQEQPQEHPRKEKLTSRSSRKRKELSSPTTSQNNIKFISWEP